MKPQDVLRTLRDRDIQKASILLNIPESLLHQLNSQYLLDVPYIINILIHADYANMIRGLKELENGKRVYTFTEVKTAIMREYNVSRQDVEDAIKMPLRRNMEFCRKCGRRIVDDTFKRTGGLCSKCFANGLEI